MAAHGPTFPNLADQWSPKWTSVKIRSAAKRSYSAGGVVRYWVGSLPRLYWRNREADEHFEGAVENLKEVITGQATILAFAPLTGRYDNAAIPSAALRADDIGFPHWMNMRRAPIIFQLGSLTQST